jgi:hypothetical protein
MPNATAHPATGAYPDFDPRLSPLAIALMGRRLGELDRLSKMALERVRHLELALEDKVSERERKILIGRGGVGAEFPRALRCVRQIVVLELELLGLRKAPDRAEPEDVDDEDETDIERPERPERPDLNDLADRPETDRQLLADQNDYRKGPLDLVVAEIRKTLGAEAPEDDPFAPPPGRCAAKPEPSNGKSAEPAAPENPAPARSRETVKSAKIAQRLATMPAHPRPAFIAAPARPRRAVTSLLAGAARNRGPPR